MRETDVLPERKLHRLQHYDYSQTGYYFITICTFQRRNLLSRVGNAVPGVPLPVIPTEIGQIVLTAWDKMDLIEPHIRTDAFCLMPNHVHGIIRFDSPIAEAVSERRGRRSLPDIVRAFKSATTREFNRISPASMKNKLWQSSYYDEIVRSDTHLDYVRSYIACNAEKWSDDEYYTP